MASFARIHGGGLVVELIDAPPILTPETDGQDTPAQRACRARVDLRRLDLRRAPPPPVTYTPKQLAQALMDDPSPAGTFALGLVAVLAQRSL